MVSRLIAQIGSGIDSADAKDGNTALHYASENGHFEVVRLLTEKGANINLTNECGETPSHLAIAYGHSLQVLQFLAEKGADLTKTNEKGEIPLHLAAMGQHLHIVQYLMQSREDTIHLVTRTLDGHTPLL
jgi:ankyrin repeat protein